MRRTIVGASLRDISKLHYTAQCDTDERHGPFLVQVFMGVEFIFTGHYVDILVVGNVLENLIIATAFTTLVWRPRIDTTASALSPAFYEFGESGPSRWHF